MFATKISQNARKRALVKAVNWAGGTSWCYNFNAGTPESKKIETINLNRVRLKITNGGSTGNFTLWRKITSSQVTGNESNPSGNGYINTATNDEFDVLNNEWLTFLVSASSKTNAYVVVAYADTDVEIDSFTLTSTQC